MSVTDGSYTRIDAKKHTLTPITTGTSVLGVKYKGGVMIAADCLGSYGSLARFRSLTRIYKVNDQCVVAGSGDYADFQYIMDMLKELQMEYEIAHDGHKLTPKAVHSFLTRILYNRRSNMNPLWNQLVIAGVDDEGLQTLGMYVHIYIYIYVVCVCIYVYDYELLLQGVYVCVYVYMDLNGIEGVLSH